MRTQDGSDTATLHGEEHRLLRPREDSPRAALWLAPARALLVCLFALIAPTLHADPTTPTTQVSSASSAGTTAAAELIAAVRAGDLAKARTLLEADPALASRADTEGWTPLHYAAEAGSVDIAKCLLDHEAAPNAAGKDGITALHYAAFKGHRNVVELLLANKADVNANLSAGRSPLDMATSAGHTAVADLLRSHGGRAASGAIGPTSPPVSPVVIYSDGGNNTSATQPFRVLYEAETAVLSGNLHVARERSGYSGSGYVTGFNQAQGNLWQLDVMIPTAQYYSIAARSGSQWGHKTNHLLVNGRRIGAVVCRPDGQFGDSVSPDVFLEAGLARFTISESWGWFNLDAIVIESDAATRSSHYRGIPSRLINPNANAKTQRVMNYITSNFGKKVISGQYCGHNKSNEVDALFRETGKYPALRGFDFIFYSPNAPWRHDAETDLAIEWSNKGGLVTFSWHWHAPIGKKAFHTKKTDFDLSRCVTEIDLSLLSLEEIEAHRRNGHINEETYRLISDVDTISAQLLKLQDANVTVLWRPLHEASGGWFWWGSKGPEPYLWLWKLIYARQTRYHGLNNLIWVWNAQNKHWYPGDDYVDIIGDDVYADKRDYGSQASRFWAATKCGTSSKVVALTENGVVMDPDLMVRDNVYWSWFALWYGGYLLGDEGRLAQTYTESDMLRKAYNHELVLTLDELPDFNQ